MANTLGKEMEQNLFFFHGEVVGGQHVSQLLKLEERYKSHRTLLSVTAPVIGCYHSQKYGQFHFSYAHYFTRALLNPAGLQLALQC